MTQRITLYLEDGFAKELRDTKPRSLSLSAWCALLIEDRYAPEKTQVKLSQFKDG